MNTVSLYEWPSDSRAMRMMKRLLSTFLPSLSFFCNIANPYSLSFVAGTKRSRHGRSAPSKLRRLSSSHSFTECKKMNKKMKMEANTKLLENQKGWSQLFNRTLGMDLFKRDFAFIPDADDNDDAAAAADDEEDCNHRLLEEMHIFMHDKVGISMSAGKLQVMASSTENNNNITASVSSTFSSPSPPINFNQYELDLAGDSNRDACRKEPTFGNNLPSDEKICRNDQYSVDLVERVFAFIDEDGDGLLSLDEMRIFLQNKVGISISVEELQALISNNNNNNTTENIGSSSPIMDFRQFLSILAGEPSPSVYNESKKDDNALVKDDENNKCIESNDGDDDDDDDDEKDCFCVFDRDGDGFISARELQSCLARMGLRSREGLEYDLEACRGMIGKVDLDGNGLVDFHEFKEMVAPFSSAIIPAI